MKFIVFILSVLLMTLSCTKIGKNITAEGYVIDPVTGKGIKDVKISITKAIPGKSISYQEVKPTFSDENGYFEISKLGGSKDYYIEADVSYYFNIGWKIDNVSYPSNKAKIKKGEKTYVELQLLPFGCLEWNVQNVNCEGSSDLMQYRRKHQFDEEFESSPYFYTQGCYNFVSTQCVKMKSGKHIFEITVTRPSGITIHYDTAYVDADGISEYNMFY